MNREDVYLVDELELFTEFFGCESPDKVIQPLAKRSQNSLLWSEDERVILTGVALSEFYQRHSFKPTREEIKVAQEEGLSSPGECIVWNKIHKSFAVAIERFNELRNCEYQTRSPKAIQKKWKDFGKNARESQDSALVPLTKSREMRWDNEYNVNSILTCSEEIYNNSKLYLQIFENEHSIVGKRTRNLEYEEFM